MPRRIGFPHAPRRPVVTPSAFPDEVAAEHPDRIAYLMARTGEAVTYRQLVERSCRAARMLRGLGAARGATVAFMLENHARFLELAWAAQRAGLRYSAISPRLTPEEVTYLLQDSGARVLVVSAATADVAREALERFAGVGAAVCVDPGVGGFLAYEELVGAEAPEP